MVKQCYYKKIDTILELKKSDLFNRGDFVKFSENFTKGTIKENEYLKGTGLSGLDSNPKLVGQSYEFKLINIA